MDTEKFKNEAKFRQELSNLINKYSAENGSDTPDFVLARYLQNCIKNFDAAVKERDEWYKPERKNPFKRLKKKMKKANKK